jgi:FkbM family methyltransferase
MFDDWVNRGRRRLALRLHPAPLVSVVDAATLRELGYASQIGQDLFLDRHVFGGQRGGVFVDVGAHDGETFSNSLFLEEQRGWTGLCIEPNPGVYERLAVRRTATCVAVAVGSANGTAEFLAISGYGEMLSGIRAQYESAHLARIERDMAVHGDSATTHQVPVRRLDELLREHSLSHFDLLCVDVEGAEADVLRSICLSEFGVRAVILENNFTDGALSRAMKRQGFQLLARIGWDDCYVRRPFEMALHHMPVPESR